MFCWQPFHSPRKPQLSMATGLHRFLGYVRRRGVHYLQVTNVRFGCTKNLCCLKLVIWAVSPTKTARQNKWRKTVRVLSSWLYLHIPRTSVLLLHFYSDIPNLVLCTNLTFESIYGLPKKNTTHNLSNQTVHQTIDYSQNALQAVFTRRK